VQQKHKSVLKNQNSANLSHGQLVTNLRKVAMTMDVVAYSTIR